MVVFDETGISNVDQTDSNKYADLAITNKMDADKTLRRSQRPRVLLTMPSETETVRNGRNALSLVADGEVSGVQPRSHSNVFMTKEAANEIGAFTEH